MNRFRLIFAAALAALGVQYAHSAAKTVSGDDLKLYDMNVDINEPTRKLTLTIDLDLQRFRVGSEREMILTPVIVSADRADSLELSPAIVAGRNRWFHYLRDGELEEKNNIYRSGSKGHPRYTITTDLQPWMLHSTVEMRALSANCCDTPVRLFGDLPSGNVLLAEIDARPSDVAVPFIFAPPVDAGPVEKTIEGKAFVTFVVNRTELKPDYMINRQELNKIIGSIDQVRNDPDAEIAGVHIKGFASPEGPYDNNVRLAAGRTETLRRYVRDLYSFNDTTITSSFEPEDWAGLRSYVRDSMDYAIEHRPQILNVIDSDIAPDEKDHMLKRMFPQDYQVILKEIYPWLRHSDYTVRYTVKVFTDIEDIRRVYASDPTRLRNVDFFTLAQSYPRGEQEFCDVMETAVKVYPDDPMINLNAAYIEMQHGEYDRAQSHLLKAGQSPVASYARGVLAARRSDYNGALEQFELADKGGVEGASQAMERVRQVRDAAHVAYKVGTSLNQQNNNKPDNK